MTALAQYSEPFYAECRAFGRIQEAGQEAIANKCYGYVLLDDEHECKLHRKFPVSEDDEEDWNFNGTPDSFRKSHDFRGRFLDSRQRRPPVRCLVKELGQNPETLTLRLLKSGERDITKLHPRGIFYLDVHEAQMIDGKLCDFGTAITTPHPLMTPELNPNLSEQELGLMADETFRLARSDFWQLDNMVDRWKRDSPHAGGPELKFRCIKPAPNDHDLRPTKDRQALYTFADPRIYDWRLSSLSSTTGMDNPSSGRSSIVASNGRWLPPKRWYRDLGAIEEQRVRTYGGYNPRLAWEYRDGLLYPHVTFLNDRRLEGQ